MTHYGYEMTSTEQFFQQISFLLTDSSQNLRSDDCQHFVNCIACRFER